jgi:hypothetical protein
LKGAPHTGCRDTHGRERNLDAAGCRLDVERIRDPSTPEADAAPTAMPKTSVGSCPESRGRPLLAVDRPSLSLRSE